jgi:shikimate dehydrogenase
MLKLAVIGKDVSQSSSPKMHTFIANNMGNKISYEAVSIAEENFEDSIDGILKNYDGFNVTIPYKLSVMPHLKSINGDAQVFGAVNTVLSKDKGGYNTDGLGFMLMLTNNSVNVNGKKVLVLGAGGAGRSVAKKLLDAGADVYIYDKFINSVNDVVAKFNGIKGVDKVQDDGYYLMVNATGVGMHKSVGISPVGEDVLKGVTVAVDLIYVPEKSQFLTIAESLDKKIINGMAMLFYQAYYAECIYFGVQPDSNQAKLLFEKYLKEVA